MGSIDDVCSEAEAAGLIGELEAKVAHLNDEIDVLAAMIVSARMVLNRPPGVLSPRMRVEAALKALDRNHVDLSVLA
jgi:hypothetical protein